MRAKCDSLNLDSQNRPDRAAHGERAAADIWRDRRLTEELVRLGHQVTLFASADSLTAARLVSCAPTALRLDSNVRDPIPYYMLMLIMHSTPFELSNRVSGV